MLLLLDRKPNSPPLSSDSLTGFGGTVDALLTRLGLAHLYDGRRDLIAAALGWEFCSGA